MTRARPFRRRAAPVVLSVLAILAAGCARSLNGATPVFGPNGAHSPPLEHGSVDEVTTRMIPGLGRILVDGQGLTLYLFELDRRSAPACYQICSVQWPPLTLAPGVERPIAGPGINPALLGTVRRTDGTIQITYHGWPLYRWLPDASPGEASGQGLNNLGGLWYVLNTAGNAVK